MPTMRRSTPTEWSPRVQQWSARTQLPLDMLALATIWLSVIPISEMLRFSSNRGLWLAARLALSVVFAIDIGVRAVLSGRTGRYLLSHPFGILAAVVPVFRLLFSLRLLHSMFSRGSLGKFLGVALLLVLNGAVLVVVFEHSAPGATITSLTIALWWTACTVSTVGYGDYTPVTAAGRIVAVCIMGVGLTTVAVVTAQIASSFSDQAAARLVAGNGEVSADTAGIPVINDSAGAVEADSTQPQDDHQRHEALLTRLQRIEAMLATEERT